MFSGGHGNQNFGDKIGEEDGGRVAIIQKFVQRQRNQAHGYFLDELKCNIKMREENSKILILFFN
jgi:hypothetical protein